MDKFWILFADYDYSGRDILACFRNFPSVADIQNVEEVSASKRDVERLLKNRICISRKYAYSLVLEEQEIVMN